MKQLSYGNTAEIYEYSKDQICKLFHTGYPEKYIQHEFSNALAVKKLGINTPLAHKIITYNKRKGIIYDKITGDTLHSKLKKVNKTQLFNWINKFSLLHKELLNHKVNNFINYKEFLKIFAEETDIIQKIDALADGEHLIHGDFHLGNIMVDQNNNLVLIDMMNICQGPALYDIARTYFLLGYNKKIQTLYLNQSGYSFKEIKPYLEIISSIRESEIQNINIAIKPASSPKIVNGKINMYI